MSPTQPPPTGRALGVALVVFTLLGWSSVPLFVKYFADYIDVWTSNGWRYGFAALLWAPALWVFRARRPAGLWRAALVPSLFNAGGQVCFGAAHYLIDPALLTFGLRLQLVFVVVGSALLFPNERRMLADPRYLGGLGLVFAGTLATVVQDPVFGQRAGVLGVGLAVASGALFAGYGLSVRRYLSEAPALLAFATVSQYTALITVGLMLALGQDHGAGGPAMGALPFGLLLLSSFIGIAVGHVAYYSAIQRLGITASSGVIQLQPIIVAIAVAAMHPEHALSPGQWATGLLAVAGAGYALWVQDRMARA